MPKYLDVFCAFCPWRETYIFDSDQNPEKTAQQLLRDHIGNTHTATHLKIFDDHVAVHPLREPGNWDRATLNDRD